MTSIELTEKHKSKLLEMCKTLFPEYINIQFVYKNLIQFSGKNNFKIHWFEFCMTHLADKMLQLGELPNYNNKLNYEFNSILQSSWWESHPVDYLYKEFKKLKQ